jgi:hypothetical protein
MREILATTAISFITAIALKWTSKLSMEAGLDFDR